MLSRVRNSRGRPINALLSCRPTVTAQPPSGPGWAHELKHDGYRFTDPCPRWSSEALHDQRRRLVKALPADCRESGSRGSKLSVGAKWNEQTFICVQSNTHDPCGNTCRRSDHADRNITDSDDRLWCQEHTVHYDRARARPHLDSEDGAIGGEYHAVGNYSNVSRTQGAQSRTAKTSATRLWHPIRGTPRAMRTKCLLRFVSLAWRASSQNHGRSPDLSGTLPRAGGRS